jgi:surface protein
MTSMFDNCRSFTSLDLSGFDTSKVTSMASMFLDCRALTDLRTNFTLNKTKMNSFINNCTSLVDLSNMKLSGTVTSINGFAYSIPVTSLDLSTLDCTYETEGINIYTFLSSNIVEFYPPTNISQNIDIRHDTKLSANSIVRIFNNLITTTETRTITLKSEVFNKLTDAQIAIAINKGWTVTAF